MSKRIVTADFKFNKDAIEEFKKLAEQKQAAMIHRHDVTIGLQGESSNDPQLDYHGNATGMTVIDNAFIHEFGTNGQPERSWLRSWFDSNEKTLQERMIGASKKSAKEDGSEDPIADFTMATSRSMKRWMASNSNGNPMLTPRTLQQREDAGIYGDTPLVATRQTIKAISGALDGREILPPVKVAPTGRKTSKSKQFKTFVKNAKGLKKQIAKGFKAKVKQIKKLTRSTRRKPRSKKK